MLSVNNLLRYALKLAEKGFPVFPIYSINEGKCGCGKRPCGSAGKHPKTSNGFHDATTDLSQIERWWKEYPASNIGLVTGKDSGLLVVDVDPRNDGDTSLTDIENRFGNLPKTKMVLTGGGGQHIYFSYPPDITIGCRTNLFPGIDIKSDGGYIIAPPSNHVSGKRYEWEVSSFENDLSPPPEWLINKLASPQSPEKKHKGEIDFNSKIVIGSRNDTLTSLVGALLRKKLSGSFALQLCLSFNTRNCCPPLPDTEVEAIVNSIAKKEFQKIQGGQHD